LKGPKVIAAIAYKIITSILVTLFCMFITGLYAIGGEDASTWMIIVKVIVVIEFIAWISIYFGAIKKKKIWRIFFMTYSITAGIFFGYIFIMVWLENV